MEKTVRSQRLGRPVKELRIEVIGDPKKSTASTRSTLTVGTADDNDLQLSDMRVSRYHLEVEQRGDRAVVRDLGTTNQTRIGSVWLHRSEAYVDLPAEVAIGGSRLRILEGDVSLDTSAPVTAFGTLQTESPAMFELLEEMQQVAPSNVPVLLLGESGSGKELFASTLHEASERRGKPFVTLDCASLTPQLFMSALFGHEKGSFTGARDRRIGAFERADGGTIFLDEIGELPTEQQQALLGVLERKRFTRVGGNQDIHVDVRVVAATNRDLREEVNEGRFRLDLYYRLAVVLLRLPPLRRRIEDLEILIAHFMKEEGATATVAEQFSDEQLKRLRSHPWPGNVRELRNAVLASLATGRAPRLDTAPMGATDELNLDYSSGVPPYKEARAAVTHAFERRYLEALMAEAGSSIRNAARTGKMDRSYLTELLRRHGLKE
ncbi:MAG: sigma 54-interacting transcriptional regulator [Myxococcota bacterium]